MFICPKPDPNPEDVGAALFVCPKSIWFEAGLFACPNPDDVGVMLLVCPKPMDDVVSVWPNPDETDALFIIPKLEEAVVCPKLEPNPGAAAIVADDPNATVDEDPKVNGAGSADDGLDALPNEDGAGVLPNPGRSFVAFPNPMVDAPPKPELVLGVPPDPAKPGVPPISTPVEPNAVLAGVPNGAAAALANPMVLLETPPKFDGVALLKPEALPKPDELLVAGDCPNPELGAGVCGVPNPGAAC